MNDLDLKDILLLHKLLNELQTNSSSPIVRMRIREARRAINPDKASIDFLRDKISNGNIDEQLRAVDIIQNLLCRFPINFTIGPGQQAGGGGGGGGGVGEI